MDIDDYNVEVSFKNAFDVDGISYRISYPTSNRNDGKVDYSPY